VRKYWVLEEMKKRNGSLRRHREKEEEEN